MREYLRDYTSNVRPKGPDLVFSTLLGMGACHAFRDINLQMVHHHLNTQEKGKESRLYYKGHHVRNGTLFATYGSTLGKPDPAAKLYRYNVR